MLLHTINEGFRDDNDEEERRINHHGKAVKINKIVPQKQHYQNKNMSNR